MATAGPKLMGPQLLSVCSNQQTTSLGVTSCGFIECEISTFPTACFAVMISVLAVNGITEAFVHAVMVRFAGNALHPIS
jgi:hypothetical protein